MKVEPVKVRVISKNRFNLLMLFTRHPVVNTFAKELNYYSNEDCSILGVVLLDVTRCWPARRRVSGARRDRGELTARRTR